MASAFIFAGNTITGNQGHGVSVNSSSVTIGGLTIGDVPLGVTTISDNGTVVAGSSGGQRVQWRVDKYHSDDDQRHDERWPRHHPEPPVEVEHVW